MVINQVQQAEVLGKIGISDGEAQAYYADAQGRVHDARLRSRCASCSWR